VARGELPRPWSGRSAPVELNTDAKGFDLPLALGLLLGSGQVAFDRPENDSIVGSFLRRSDLARTRRED
jgi:hypothetical protein